MWLPGADFFSVKIVNARGCEGEKDDCKDLQKKSLHFWGSDGVTWRRGDVGKSDWRLEFVIAGT